jgi:hypothetical protein
MKRRRTIFDSESERELFSAIRSAWEPAFKLYPHIPFANLVDLNPQELVAHEMKFLHKTTVDYALTTADGRPLLAIEFDGLGHGHSKDGAYLQSVPSRDHSRAWKLDLKARVANAAGLPFIILSYDEKLLLEADTNLLMAHAIIGQFIANWHTPQRLRELYEDAQNWLDEWPTEERHEQIQDLTIQAEVETSLTWNPVARRAAELLGRLRHVDPLVSTGHHYTHEPPRPENTTPLEPGFDPAVFEHWWHSINRIGCVYTIATSRGQVTRTVWARNFGDHFSPYGFLDDVAELVTAQAALELYGLATC